MKLYFIRHGKTEWNVEGRFQGAGGDSPLLPAAIEELHLLGRHLARTRFDRIYTSDLPRAVRSAQILQEESCFPAEIIQTAALREWRLGKLEGAKIATIEAIYPHQMTAFRHNLAKFDHSMFEAESVYQTTHRTTSFIKSLKDEDCRRLLFVGHGANLTASIRTLLGYATPLLRKKGGLANASVTILETEDFDSFQLLTWNNLDYLYEDETAISRK
ncbi:histidine phosphatase family protein [Streptococcus panodentis]|uniref:Histidine phosphatase family protein n=1 Tax=Streptococcus panodentis TaxID=1581472 RepID=A0ABS5AV30_9STRE|nr:MULTISPECIES: histidine phosphatase family protein [Streptococcus]KXT84340.1 Phosphoglycerate mutase family 5 [Streptococcus sp. DD11]MBP2620429.1 histidine phosphatase family protein [Streptococcus panodentis]